MKSQNKNTSNLRRTFKKVVQRKTSLISLIVLIIIILLAILGNVIWKYDPFVTETSNRLAPPDSSHWFGTDNLGRDLLSRVLYGSRISLSISVASVLTALIFGTLLGIVAGYVGGVVDNILSMIIEAICAFPTILLGLLLAAVLGSGIPNIVLAIGISNIPFFARIVRSMAISIRELEYVEGAVTTGLNHLEIITRYLLPNMSSVIIVQTSLSAASAILTESSLSFMGVGVQPPAASWGALLRDGYVYVTKAPWLSIAPGVAIMITVIAMNFLGDGLRDALDVKIRIDK